MSGTKFPTGRSGRQRLEFFPAPFRAPLRAFAAILFPWKANEVLICHIVDRGWCVPSGRVEPGESSLEAAVRESREEAGAVLTDVIYIGCYRITENRDVRWADVYAGQVAELGEITHSDESDGREFVTMDTLPERYYLWNPLIEAVFNHAHGILQRHLRLISGE